MSIPHAIVNDVHARLNATRVAGIVHPASIAELQEVVRAANERRTPLAICGGRHAMGGQQFLADQLLVDCTSLNRIHAMDHARGLITVEAGIRWPALIDGYLRLQREASPGSEPRWGIRQKQTGADDLTLGGALSANAHGRGLRMAPIVSDVESFTLVAPSGELLECSRTSNPRLFSMAIGGYGLFGPIATVTLRLGPRVAVRRIVRVIDIEDAVNAAQRRLDAGFLYGDFQFDIDPWSPSFLTRGVFCCYEPIDGPAPEPPPPSLAPEDWVQLLALAHRDKRQAFAKYSSYYVSTEGQVDWSDRHQLTTYVDGYHAMLDARTGGGHPAGEVITELYVPPQHLVEFLHEAAQSLVRNRADVIYGTIRIIEQDAETFLPWATSRFACVIFNLHVEHTPESIARSGDAFRALIDLALERSGSFYLTYHRHATPTQIRTAYPAMDEFLRHKLAHDPNAIFASDWYRWLCQAA